MAEENYEIKQIYQGGYDSFKSSSGGGLAETHMPFKDISVSTDARTANIVKEIGGKISSGVKNIEASQVFPEVFDSIPKQQFKELNRLIELTGVKVTLHGPLIEASGLTKQGFTESGRESAERHMKTVIDKNQIISPEGGTPITFHASAELPGGIKPKGKEFEETLVINPDTGAVNKIPLKERYFPGDVKKNVQKEIEQLNQDQWSSQLTNLGFTANKAHEFIEAYKRESALAENEKRQGTDIDSRQKQVIQEFNIGKSHLNDSYRQLKSLYDVAYNAAKNNDTNGNLNKLNELKNKIEGDVKKINKDPKNVKNIALMQNVIEEGLETFDKIAPPKIFKPLKEFAEDKTTTTFGNVALYAYKKYGDKAPIVSIENPPVDSGSEFTTGEDIKNLVVESRKKFVKAAVKEGTLSESEAKKQAEKLIGATWDVGHINTLRKFGYDKKDILKETEKVAPFVKHVHLADNFGMKDSELPMGMGNVPIKEIMQKLGKEGFEGKKVVEALQWWQHFSPQGSPPDSPLGHTLEAFGSPMYSSGAGPYWHQTAGLQQGYLGGYGDMLPQGHYQTLGAGFSQLPMELGGKRGGAGGSRMSGNPME